MWVHYYVFLSDESPQCRTSVLQVLLELPYTPPGTEKVFSESFDDECHLNSLTVLLIE